MPAKSLSTNLPGNVRFVAVEVELRGLTLRLRVDEFRFDYGELLGLVRRRQAESRRDSDQAPGDLSASQGRDVDDEPVPDI